MQIKFNHETETVAEGLNLEQFLAGHGISVQDMVACAVDQEIIPRAQWKDKILEENMLVEIFTVVGGG